MLSSASLWRRRPPLASPPIGALAAAAATRDDDDDVSAKRAVVVVETNIMRYLRTRVFGDAPRRFFAQWPIEQILAAHAQWEHAADSTWYYVIYNTVRRLTTHIGCTRDLQRRFSQHQGLIDGGPTSTRPAAGEWRLIVCVRVPPLRNWRVDELRRETQGKGIAFRTQRVIAYAHARQLDWRVSAEVLDVESALYMPDVVASLLALGVFTSRTLAPRLVSCHRPPPINGGEPTSSSSVALRIVRNFLRSQNLTADALSARAQLFLATRDADTPPTPRRITARVSASPTAPSRKRRRRRNTLDVDAYDGDDDDN